jgi:hypothetical protein
MAKPTKVNCKFKELGGHGAALDIHLHVPGFGKMKCGVRYDLESQAMLDIVVRNGKEFEKTLDGMQIDPAHQASLGRYQFTLAEGLSKLMGEVKEKLADE